MNAFIWLDWILFIVFAINILYLLFYSIASRFTPNKVNQKATRNKKIAIFIPAYKEDAVIIECVESCLTQNYPTDKYDIIVISDQMKDETNEALRSMGAEIVEVFFENSSKSKALNYAMSFYDDYEVALILDGDNLIEPDFLLKINQEMVMNGSSVVQAHRTAKNTNTNLAYLDAVSEEINNSIFRQGHVNVGLSSAFIGSGMAIRYDLLKTTMYHIDSVGEDRELEMKLLLKGYHFVYLPDAILKDEKTQNLDNFSSQRKRWLSVQFQFIKNYFPVFIRQLMKANLDVIDKYLQQFSIPRILLIGWTILFAVATSFISSSIALKWWGLCISLFSALILAIPNNFWNRKMSKALWSLPSSFLTMFLLIFKLKGAHKSFIHTEHGVEDKNK